MNTYHESLDQIHKAHTLIANMLKGREIRPEWNLPSIDDVTQHGAINIIVELSDGNTYRINVTQIDDRGWEI